MGYYDADVDARFKITGEGITLFYPYSFWGKGYVIPNTEKKQAIRKYTKRGIYFLLALIMISISGITWSIVYLAIPWWAGGLIYLAICMVEIPAEYLFWRQLTKGLVPVAESLTYAESFRNKVKSFHIVVLWVVEILALLMFVVGVWVVLQAVTDIFSPWYEQFVGISGLLFLGFFAIVFGYMIKVKNEG
jgi:hypothetical protein